MAAKIEQYSLCPSCKKFEPKTYEEFCKKCGTKLVNECPGCNKPFYKTGAFCGQCGTQLLSQ
jgi:predicted amidophosphoribosyltransferase